MKWSRLIVRLKTSFIWASVVAMEQTAVNVYMPGIYRREWKNSEGGNVQVLTISLRDSVSDVYQLSMVTSRIVSHNERMIYSREPDVWLAVYNAATKQLMEVAGSRTCSFLPQENALLLGKDYMFKVSGDKM